jgi:protein-L-isoaspartate O-methyltransferase
MQKVGFASVLLAVAVAMGWSGIQAQSQPSSAHPAGQTAAAVKAQLEEANRSGDWTKAALAAEQLVALTEPDHVEALYAAARAHARLGHRELAYLLLGRAVGAGFGNRQRLLEDEAFSPLRGEELFRGFARKAWARGYTNLLERADRERVQKLPEIMKALAFRPGERVADIGAGTGYFTFQVAEAVGPTGRVIALDIAPEMLEYLDLRIKARQAENVSTRRVASDDPQLAPGSVDTILMVDAIHYVKDRSAYAKKLAAGLAPGGRLVVIDYRPKPMSERPWGPPPEQQFPKEQLDMEMSAGGFVPVASFDFLPEQFFVVYQVR